MSSAEPIRRIDALPSSRVDGSLGRDSHGEGVPFISSSAIQVNDGPVIDNLTTRSSGNDSHSVFLETRGVKSMFKSQFGKLGKLWEKDKGSTQDLQRSSSRNVEDQEPTLTRSSTTSRISDNKHGYINRLSRYLKARSGRHEAFGSIPFDMTPVFRKKESHFDDLGELAHQADVRSPAVRHADGARKSAARMAAEKHLLLLR